MCIALQPEIGGAGGLATGDVIIGIDNCFIESKDNWKTCLIDSITKSSQGYCVSNLFVSQESQLSLVPGKCCGEDSKRHLCFKDAGSFHDTADNSVTPGRQRDLRDTVERVKLFKKRNNVEDGLCLPVRLLLNTFTGNCNTTKDCMMDEPRCLKPVIEDKLTRLMQLHREDKEPFLFYGYPGELFATISVIEFKPRLNQWIPVRPLLWYDSFLRYLASFSLALGVLNAVPCFFLDGHWITTSLIEALFRNKLTIQRRTLLSNLITLCGTALVLATVALAFLQLAMLMK